jgi:hypothetical protein
MYSYVSTSNIDHPIHSFEAPVHTRMNSRFREINPAAQTRERHSTSCFMSLLIAVLCRMEEWCGEEMVGRSEVKWSIYTRRGREDIDCEFVNFVCEVCHA